MTQSSTLSLTIAPLLPAELLVAATVICAILALLLPLSKLARGLRLLAVAILALFIAQPQRLSETRTPVPRTIAIITDDSGSNTLSDRTPQQARALAALRTQLDQHKDTLSPVFLTLSDTASHDTRLTPALEQAFSGIPANHRAGAVVIGDGLFHDLAVNSPITAPYGPIQFWQTGHSDDHDQRLSFTTRPAYGIVGETVTARVKVSSDGAKPFQPTRVSVIEKGKTVSTHPVTTQDTDIDIPLNITHTGGNVFLLRLDHREGEQTFRNNDAVIEVEGVRDRLHVLLVSAQPYIGGRMWRNLLTSDPAIDLVHFTILRTPQSLDPTPSYEMALIPFPFDDLFDNRLYDFDLIILDRYRTDNIMPDRYLNNIASFVKKGGALLDVAGKDFAGDQSISKTDLGDILPTRPTGRVITTPFTPRLVDVGKRHPVTSGLQDMGKWSDWSLMAATTAASDSNVLMSGADDLPLLAVRHVDKGRVAQLTSDQIWLWARGVDGGGPSYPLMRPLVHWLLGDPSLDEEQINVTTTADGHRIVRHTLKDSGGTVDVTGPDGTAKTQSLAAAGNGIYVADLPDMGDGLYHLKADALERDVYIGTADTPEWTQVVATAEWIKPSLVTPSHGSIVNLEKSPEPRLRLPATPAYDVTGSTSKPLLPLWVWAVLLLATLIGAWLVEGRRSVRAAV